MRVLRLLSFALSVAFFSITASAADKVALVIGNGAYQNTVALPNPPNDATDVAAALERIGFKVILGVDLDQKQMVEKVGDFEEQARDAGTTLFFYAGHGLQVNGLNYLVPIDAKLERPTSLQFETIETSLVLNSMSGSGRTAIALLDACRNNPLSRSFTRSLGKTRNVNVGQGLAAPSVGAGGMIIGFSTAPGEVAADGEGRNSPFTSALLKNINVPGLEIQQLMTRVKADVYSATKETQEPWHNSSLRSEVYLVAPDVAPQVKPEEKPEPEPAGPDAQQASIEFEWNAVKDSKSADVLRAFKEKHKNNAMFLALADERLNQLTIDGLGDGGVVQPEGDAPPDAAPQAEQSTAGTQPDFDSFVAQALDVINGTNTVPRTIKYLELKKPAAAPGTKTEKMELSRLATARSIEEFMSKAQDKSIDVPIDFQDFARCRVSNLKSSGCGFMREDFVGRMISALENRGAIGDDAPDFDIVKIEGRDDVLFSTRPKRNDGEMTMAVALVSTELKVLKSFAFNLSKRSYGIDAGDPETRYEVMGAMIEGDDLYLSVDAGLRCKKGTPIKRNAGVMFRMAMNDDAENLKIKWITPFNVSDANMAAGELLIYTGTIGNCGVASYIYGIDKQTGEVYGREKLPNGADKLMLVDKKLFVNHYPAASVYSAQ
jgi:hypothetical protein